MAYVPDAVHDVFVSYSHIDNEVIGSATGWIDQLAEHLRSQLKRRLGSGQVDVWTDRQLALNKPLTPELTREVSCSALLLVVMSPAYLNSEWCRRERQAFLKIAQDRLTEGRIFIVNNLDVDPGSRPPEFGDHDGWRFWVKETDVNATRTLGAINPLEEGFCKAVIALSAQMAKVLMPLAMPTNRTPSRKGAPEAASEARIFVARSTDDLEDRESDLRNYLMQGFRIAPRRIYAQPTQAEFESAMRAELEGCRLFVQLLSVARGSEMPFDPSRRLPVLLHDMALSIGLPALCWRDRAINPATIADVEHRRLVESAIACPIEEFQRMVVDKAKSQAKSGPEPRAYVFVDRNRDDRKLAEQVAQEPAREESSAKSQAKSGPEPRAYVFVDRDLDDRKLAIQVAQELAREGVSVYFPLDSGKSEDIREDKKRSLYEADGVLLVFGASEVASVRERLQYQIKVLKQRDTPPAVFAVFEGPPGERQKLEQLCESWIVPDMLVIDASEGVTPQHIGTILSRLRERSAHAQAR